MRTLQLWLLYERLICRIRGHDTYIYRSWRYHVPTGLRVSYVAHECARCFYQRR